MLDNFMSIFGYTMAVLFVGLGFYLVFSKGLDSTLGGMKEMRTIFGVVLISYGLFRSVIIYQKRNMSGDDDDD